MSHFTVKITQPNHYLLTKDEWDLMKGKPDWLRMRRNRMTSGADWNDGLRSYTAAHARLHEELLSWIQQNAQDFVYLELSGGLGTASLIYFRSKDDAFHFKVAFADRKIDV